jgi:2-hydroxychromene-2-carboxylate isomerase
MSAKEVVFYFDYASPYSYLGATQIERVAREAGATLTFRPILLGGLFKAIGTPMVPLFEMTETRRRYQGRDLMHWASHWSVPFRWPSNFPMNTISCLRMTIASGQSPALIQALYRAYWGDDRDLNDKKVLAEIAASVGEDGPALLEKTADPAIKQALIDNTAEAERAGVFGVPTFRVGDEIWFGQDRLDLLAHALRR